jgi:hypothetical protein
MRENQSLQTTRADLPVCQRTDPSTPEQARIVALLVESIDIGIDGLRIRLRGDRPGDLACEIVVGGIGQVA